MVALLSEFTFGLRLVPQDLLFPDSIVDVQLGIVDEDSIDFVVNRFRFVDLGANNVPMFGINRGYPTLSYTILRQQLPMINSRPNH
jgi:hypothetical protein